MRTVQLTAHLLLVGAAALALLLTASGVLAAGPGSSSSIRDCGKFVGPTWFRYSHSGRNYYVSSRQVSCSIAKRYAKKFVGGSVRPSQLRKNIPYPKYVLSGGPKGFTCWVATKPSGLDDHKNIAEGTCEKGPLPRYSEEADLYFFWGATGG